MGLFGGRRRRDEDRESQREQGRQNDEAAAKARKHAKWIATWDAEQAEHLRNAKREEAAQAALAEHERVERLVKWGDDIVSVQSIETIARLNVEIDSAVKSYQVTETEFSLGRPFPFWQCASDTFKGIEIAEATLSELVQLKHRYYETVLEVPGKLPPYIDLDGIGEAGDIITNLNEWIVRLREDAHAVDRFIHAYGVLLLQDTFVRGFDRLDKSLMRIEISIQRSTAILSSDLSRISGELSDLTKTLERQRDTARSSDNSAQHTRDIVRAINNGMGSATGAITASHRTAQSKANTSISELRQIRARVEGLRR